MNGEPVLDNNLSMELPSSLVGRRDQMFPYTMVSETSCDACRVARTYHRSCEHRSRSSQLVCDSSLRNRHIHTDRAFITPQKRHYTKVSADTFVQSTARIASGCIAYVVHVSNGEKEMNSLAKTLAAIAVGAVLATDALAQGAASLVVPIENEPAPRLFVETPLPDPLVNGVAFIPYRLQNLRILPIDGPGAVTVSPRVDHRHITVDDLPRQWADYGQSNTIILGNLPRGEHKVLIEVLDASAAFHTAQSVTFKSSGK